MLEEQELEREKANIAEFTCDPVDIGNSIRKRPMSIALRMYTWCPTLNLSADVEEVAVAQLPAEPATSVVHLMDEL